MIGLRPLVERRKFRISAKLSPCAARECLDHVLTTPWVRVRLRKISVLPPHAQIGAHTHIYIICTYEEIHDLHCMLEAIYIKVEKFSTESYHDGVEIASGVEISSIGK